MIPKASRLWFTASGPSANYVGEMTPRALALDLFGFGVYPFPQGAAGAMSFHDPLEGTETSIRFRTVLANSPIPDSLLDRKGR